jgi:hypothetical protein
MHNHLGYLEAAGLAFARFLARPYRPGRITGAMTLLLSLTGPFAAPGHTSPLSSLTPAVTHVPQSGCSSGSGSAGTIEGWEFTVNVELEARALGVWDALDDGLAGAHDVGLFEVDGTALASVTVPAGTSAELVGGSRFVSIPPVQLQPGRNYVLVALYGVAPNSGLDAAAQNCREIAPAFTLVDGRRQFPASTLFVPPPGLFQFGPNLLFAEAATEQTLTAEKDSFLRKGNQDRNEGANPGLRLQASGDNRIVVGFDPAAIDDFGDVTTATLVLTISENANNWGQNDDRTVDAHPLAVDFAEGNGQNAGVPGAQSTRGSGPGVTWKCAEDADIANQQTDCDPEWGGGDFGAATADPVLHVNGLSGEVSWDVTDDVLAGVSAWLIKKTSERQAGKVSYFSRQGADAAGDPDLAPRLILER